MGELKLKKLLSADELADLLGFDVQYIWRLAREGKIKKVPGMGRNVRFNPETIEKQYFSETKTKK